MRPIQKAISSLPDHFVIGVKMTSKNIFFTLCFWFEFPQILGLGFSVNSNIDVALNEFYKTESWMVVAEESEGSITPADSIQMLAKMRDKKKKVNGRKKPHAGMCYVSDAGSDTSRRTRIRRQMKIMRK